MAFAIAPPRARTAAQQGAHAPLTKKERDPQVLIAACATPSTTHAAASPPPDDPFGIACAPTTVAFTGASSSSTSYSASSTYKRTCATTSSRGGAPAPDVTVYAAPVALPKAASPKAAPGPDVAAREDGWDVRADTEDLALDGKHWREQFGGAVGDGPQMGAFVLLGPMGFVAFRLLLALGAGFIFGFVLVQERGVPFRYWWIYFEHWVLLLGLVYFVLAALLTAQAVLTPGPIEERTPALVWLCWAAYGMLLPASQVLLLAYMLVLHDGEWKAHWVCNNLALPAMVALDAWVNRQPYYATFHGSLGLLLCWGFFAFSLLHWHTGGTNEFGDPYIYWALCWGRAMSPGKLLLTLLFLLYPLFTFLFWMVVWARRRLLLTTK